MKLLTLIFFSLFLTLVSSYPKPVAAQVSCSFQVVGYNSEKNQVDVKITAKSSAGEYSIYVSSGERSRAKAGPGGVINSVSAGDVSPGQGYTVNVSALGHNDCSKDGNNSFLVPSTHSPESSNNSQNNTNSNNSGTQNSGNDTPEKSVNTAFGNISTDPAELVNTILTIAIGIAGGIAFLMIVFGGFRLVFSQGDPKAIQEARETITSAIIGLILIVFSVFLLNLIGVDILGLPIGD